MKTETFDGWQWAVANDWRQSVLVVRLKPANVWPPIGPEDGAAFLIAYDVPNPDHADFDPTALQPFRPPPDFRFNAESMYRLLVEHHNTAGALYQMNKLA